MTLVSSANNIGSESEFIHRGGSLICILNNRVSRIDPWETPCFIVPQSEKKSLVFLRLFYFNFLSFVC